MSNPIITLHPWEYARGFQVGIERFVANWGTNDAQHYDRARMEEDRNAQAAAALCEIAVARFTNQYWPGHVWHRSEHGRYRHMADVGSRIEVRRIRTGGGVPVRRTDAGREVWAARMADDEYRTVELLGYVNADEAIPSIPDGETWARYPIESLVRPWEIEDAEADALFEEFTAGWSEVNRAE